MLSNNRNNFERLRESRGKFYILKQLQDWFEENNIPSKVRDVIILKLVKGLFKYKFHETPEDFKN